eukprot:gene10248-8166_t
MKANEDPSFPVGTRVLFRGVQDRSDLDGVPGIVVDNKVLLTRKLWVKLEDKHHPSGDTVMLVRTWEVEAAPASGKSGEEAMLTRRRMECKAIEDTSFPEGGRVLFRGVKDRPDLEGVPGIVVENLVLVTNTLLVKLGGQKPSLRRNRGDSFTLGTGGSSWPRQVSNIAHEANAGAGAGAGGKAKAHVPSFSPGARVLFRGLQARSDLNGLPGIVVNGVVMDNGRLLLKLEDEHHPSGTTTLCVKPQNLEATDDSDMMRMMRMERAAPSAGPTKVPNTKPTISPRPPSSQEMEETVEGMFAKLAMLVKEGESLEVPNTEPSLPPSPHKGGKAKADAPSFPQGAKVLFRGLQARADLNGLPGIVVDGVVTDNGRLLVKLEDEQHSSGTTTLCVKPQNLEAAAGRGKSAAPSVVPAKLPNMEPTISLPAKQCVLGASPFYPFGNVPAKLLTHLIPLHQENPNVLQLGCGDPRHVLYTLWATEKAGGLAAKQKLSVVCVDSCPSILARNVVLFKLITDGCDRSLIWTIFYSKRINAETMTQLTECASQLLSASDVTASSAAESAEIGAASLQGWHSTALGKAVRFADLATLEAVRAIWGAYARGQVSTKLESAFQKHQDSSRGLVHNSVAITAVKTTLPVMHEPPVYNHAVHSDIHRKYARTGETPCCISGSSSQGGGRPTPAGGKKKGLGKSQGLELRNNLVNPMMLLGPQQAAANHDGSDPTLNFHLALAYITTLPERGGGSGGKGASSGSPPDADDIHKLCFKTFSEWCDAALASMKKGLRVFMFYGDALDFCQVGLYVD